VSQVLGFTTPTLTAHPHPVLPLRSYDPRLQEVKAERSGVEARIAQLAGEAARDLGLVMDKTIKLEWHKVANTRTR
jgi:DNA mismatch repair protein MSH2